MNTLEELRQSYMREAQGIPEYNLLSKTELFNGYCDAEESHDEIKRSQYWAAIILRYWYKIPMWILSCKSLKLQPEDFVVWLEDCLNDALYYRSWRWEFEAIVRKGEFISWKLDENGKQIPNEHYWKVDPNAADKSMNYFCSAKRGKMYQFANKDIRKNDGQVISIEGVTDENGKTIDFLGEYSPLEKSGAQELVEIFLKNQKPIEALIIDGVAYQDSFNYELNKVYNEDIDSQGNLVNKRYFYNKEDFNLRKLVKHLSSIDSKFIKDYFCKTYLLSNEEGEAILSKVASMNNPKWYKYIKKTVVEIKGNKKLLGCLLDTE